MNDLLAKIPKPVLVALVLVVGLVFIVLNDPLKDECEVQAKKFDRNTKGLLFSTKVKNKIQFAKLPGLKDICRQGNSLGACSDYLEGLRQVANELKFMNDNCKVKYAQENEGFLSQISSALQVMALVAWGERPPTGPAERAGWLAEPDIKSFCNLKKTFILLAGEEGYVSIRNSVYTMYPDEWSEKSLPTEEAPSDNRKAEDRPRALKTAANPWGKLSQKEVFERSLFSIRCDLYL